jgi:two-component system, chemotaxis family, CheB/CheR fusion protein
MSSPAGSTTDGDGLEELLEFIRESRGFDFTGYKRTSLTRRINKRMTEVGVSDYFDYKDLLETTTEEFTALFNTILINVTSFFRDTEAWSSSSATSYRPC